MAVPLRNSSRPLQLKKSRAPVTAPASMAVSHSDGGGAWRTAPSSTLPVCVARARWLSRLAARYQSLGADDGCVYLSKLVM